MPEDFVEGDGNVEVMVVGTDKITESCPVAVEGFQLVVATKKHAKIEGTRRNMIGSRSLRPVKTAITTMELFLLL